jgi:hypothetical protein
MALLIPQRRISLPEISVVSAFVARVEAGDYVGAIEDYYDCDACTQENEAIPKVGRDAIILAERTFMETMRSIVAERLAPPLIGSEHVAIRWRFKLSPPKGAIIVLDEIAFQTWRGDRIISEKFFFDPKLIGRKTEH